MSYSVHQPWDPLKVCVVGKSYGPDFYSFMENKRLRNLFEKIAIETEEDFQNIIKTLKKFNVEIIRPDVPDVMPQEYITRDKRLPPPISMTPRDQMIMVGEKFFVFPYSMISYKASGRNLPMTNWTEVDYQFNKGADWPQEFTDYKDLPEQIKEELTNKGFIFEEGVDLGELARKTKNLNWWDPITSKVRNQGNLIIENKFEHLLNRIPTNGITRIGKDLIFGVGEDIANHKDLELLAEQYFTDYRCHWITTGGHIDGAFCPVVPGLIVSILDMPTYEKTFPGWEVCYLEGESWHKVKAFSFLKSKNEGRWWIKGHEYDDELINYVETWLSDWVGYCEETVFDVNILTIDEKNIIVNGYNEKAFKKFEEYGITAHICPLRHRYFWDGGIHCSTLDLHRQGVQKDFSLGSN